MEINEKIFTCFFAGIFCVSYAWLARQFCKKYLTCSSKKSAVFLILVSLSYGAGNLICQNVSYLAGVIFFHLMFVGITLFLFQEGKEKKILAAVLWIAIMELAAEIGGSCFSILMLLYLHTASKEILIQGAGESVICLFQILTMAGFVSLLREPLVPVMTGKIRKWYLIAAFPPFCIIGIKDFFTWGITRGIVMRGGESWGLYQNQLISNAFNLVLALLCLLGLGFYIFGLDRIYREQTKREQYQAQIDAYGLLEEQYVKMERLRHDMKNHILGLQGLLEHQEWEKADQYLQKMLETGDLSGARETTGNCAVDALLSQKKQRAEEKGISWECAVYLPGNIKTDDFDLCVMMGNLLDNAIEACEKISKGSERRIAVRSERKKDFLILEVTNSIDQAEAFDSDMISGKRAAAGKRTAWGEGGIGLWNVQETVKGYQGAMKIERKEQIVEVKILLPCKTVYDRKETS